MQARIAIKYVCIVGNRFLCSRVWGNDKIVAMRHTAEYWLLLFEQHTAPDGTRSENEQEHDGETRLCCVHITFLALSLRCTDKERKGTRARAREKEGESTMWYFSHMSAKRVLLEIATFSFRCFAKIQYHTHIFGSLVRVAIRAISFGVACCVAFLCQVTKIWTII